MANLAFSEEEIFDRIVEEGVIRGTVTQEEYASLVEDVLNDMVDMGEIRASAAGQLTQRIGERFGEFERRYQEEA